MEYKIHVKNNDIGRLKVFLCFYSPLYISTIYAYFSKSRKFEKTRPD